MQEFFCCNVGKVECKEKAGVMTGTLQIKTTFKIIRN